MAKVYKDCLDRIVLDDNNGNTILFQITGDKVSIYQDSQNLVTRTIFESLQENLEIPTKDIAPVFEQIQFLLRRTMS